MNTRPRSITAATSPKSATVTRPPPVLRREQLRIELLATVDSLHRRRADLVPENLIADYVALHWIEWSGGALRLTVTGQNICEQMRAGMK